MAGDPRRTLLVISEIPHPWALLRDRLRGELLSVAWSKPAGVQAAVARLDPGPWVVAGGEPVLPPDALDALSGCLCAVLWVGQPPPGLSVRPSAIGTWQEAAATLGDKLRAPAPGLAFAPGRGVVVAATGAVVERAPHLEALLAAPLGELELASADGRRLRAAARRAAAQARRHNLPVSVAVRGRRIGLEPA